MKQVKNIFNGKNAFQSIDLNDISRPIADKEHVQLQNILVEMYRDILTYCQKRMDSLFSWRLSSWGDSP